MPSSFADIDHLLKRSGFGGNTSEINALVALDWSDAVEHVLNTSLAASTTTNLPNLDEGQSWWNKYRGSAIYWGDRAVSSACPLQEKMTLFWHGHLCSAISKVHNFQQIFDQNQLFRSHGMGSFATMLQMASVQPAMLIYLDNETNEKGSPNENFARELMELFTLGVGHYTEDDIRASARAWTGHGLSEDDERYEFHADKHDYDNKTFMGITQNWDGPDIITHLTTGASGLQTARYLARKMWEFFAYANPSDTLVEELATSFAAAGLNITSLLRSIFLRPEFRSDQALNGLVRGPFDYLVALMRKAGVDSSVGHPEYVLESIGQVLFQPPNVAGWKQNEAWLSPANLWGKRSATSRVRWHLYNETAALDHDYASATEAVTAALSVFGIYNASPATRANLEDFYNTEPHRWARRAGLLLLTPLSAEFQMA